MKRNSDLEKYIEEYRRRRIETKREYLYDNILDLVQSFQKKLLILITKQSQCKDSMYKMKYIYLCQLLSSGYTESYEAILGISDTNLYLDECENHVYWYPELIYRNFDEDMKMTEKILGAKFIRLERRELFHIKKILLLDDWELLGNYFGYISQESINLIRESGLHIEDEIMFLFGNYMDNLKILWHEGGETS